MGPQFLISALSEMFFTNAYDAITMIDRREDQFIGSVLENTYYRGEKIKILAKFFREEYKKGYITSIDDFNF